MAIEELESNYFANNCKTIIYNIHMSSKDKKYLQVGTNIRDKIIQKTYGGGFNLGTHGVFARNSYRPVRY